VFAVQNMHPEDNNVDSMERTAKQSLKRMLIAKLCENISQSCTQHALEIARLDAEQAEMVYKEAVGDLVTVSCDDLSHVTRALSEQSEKNASTEDRSHQFYSNHNSFYRIN
jgi:type II secretory pathway component PulM